MNFLIVATAFYAQTPGTLDPTFGNNGVITTNLPGYSIYGTATAVFNDGKFIVSGYSTPNDDFVVVKYNTDGSLDNTFGNNGLAITSISSLADRGYAIAIQTDGKIVVAGYTSGSSNPWYSFAVARYTEDGSLDTTFGSNGIVITQIGSLSGAYALGIQSDGKIVAAGYSQANTTSDQLFTLVRYNIDGTLDNSFGTNGITIIATAITCNVGITAISMQTDGKIIASGPNKISNYDFTTIRCNPTGTLDSLFGINGKVETSVSSINDYSTSNVLQTDGKIIVAGYSYDGTNSCFAVVRYNSDGTIDNTFGTSGFVSTSLGYQIDEAYSVAIQNNGKIILAGTSTNSSNYNFGMVRYNSDGSLDNSFGNGGIAITQIDSSAYSIAKSVKIQPDGSIIVAGYSYDVSQNFAVAKYYGDNTTNIIQNNLLTDFEIFPNPVNSVMNIVTESEIVKIEILDLNGKSILLINRNIIDCSLFERGVYFLKVEFKNGSNSKMFLKI